MTGHFQDWVFVALGSNLGNSEQTFHHALNELSNLSAGPLLCSSFWKTEPVECPPGSPPFLNAVAGFPPHAHETPESLLARLKVMEKNAGRQPKKVMNESRPLDLDLLVFGQETRNRPELTVPHPRFWQRRFVLGPLAEIAPNLIIPGQTESVSNLLAKLSSGT